MKTLPRAPGQGRAFRHAKGVPGRGSAGAGLSIRGRATQQKRPSIRHDLTIVQFRPALAPAAAELACAALAFGGPLALHSRLGRQFTQALPRWHPQRR